MQCPYCKVHYDDSERICPVCGKRPGTVAKAKHTMADLEKSAAAQRKSGSYNKTSRTAAVNRQKQRKTTTDTASKRTATGTPRPDHPYTPPAAEQRTTTDTPRSSATYRATADNWQKKSSGGGLAKGILIVVIVLFLLQVVFSFVEDSRDSFSSLIEDSSWTDSLEELFDDSASYDYLSETPEWLIGTWMSTDGTIQFTQNEDGSVSYIQDGLILEIEDATDLYEIVWDRDTGLDKDTLSWYLPESMLSLDLSQYKFYEMDSDMFEEMYDSDEWIFSSLDFAVPSDAAVITEMQFVDPVTGNLVTLQKQGEKT
ncbi:MAG: hypothetical protein ACI4PQ_01130 [Butyricicoccaceae bacterium]